MTIIERIEEQPSGARFFRADLHIHSFGGSHDVKDSLMTPQEIVNVALAEDFGLIAITDHNEIVNVAAAIKAAQGKPILLVPGVELSTPEGHLLVYFSSVEELEHYYGKLDFADRGNPNSRCQTSLLECLRKINVARGFAILAHVDGDGGLEKKLSGYPPYKGDIIGHPALLGIELRSAASSISYSDKDPVSQRAQFGRKRVEALGLGARQFLARVLFSDSHSRAALGKNATGKDHLTRIKMDAPSFEGLRIALQDADARIRLEDEIPSKVPCVLGTTIEGGFLDAQTIHFSKNLNCIIGGRGTGKSTFLEIVRCLTDASAQSKLVDSEVWPETFHIVYADQSGQSHMLVRRINEDIENLDDAEFGLVHFPMESYGQNETAQTSVKAQSDPGALLDCLDKFIDISRLSFEDESLREELLENQTAIEKAEGQVARIPEFKRLLANTKQQLKACETANAQEIVILERQVAQERVIRESLDKQIAGLGSLIKNSSSLPLFDAIETIANPADLKVGIAEFTKIRDLISALKSKAQVAEQDLTDTAKVTAGEAKTQIENWKKREQQVSEEIDAKRKDLQKQGVKLDLAYIKKLANDESSFATSLKNLAAWETKLKELRNTRRDLLLRRQKVRTKVTALRQAYAAKANKALTGVLNDLSVNVKFIESAWSPAAEDIIQQAMNWKTIQVPRASLIVEQVTVPRLLQAIAKKDVAALLAVVRDDGDKAFSKADALDLLKTLGEAATLFQLERCEVEDRPRITVTKKIANPSGSPKVMSKDFSKLSLGQQQSVLLALMLSSDSNAPLIIDQPEDNLDGEFIFYSLVPALRQAKERRQVIIVTHNANIAVLGDAEQIIALKSTSDNGQIVARGSIDDPATRKIVCQILEGAEEAFKKRANIYGLL